jgi:hypothetical protein
MSNVCPAIILWKTALHRSSVNRTIPGVVDAPPVGSFERQLFPAHLPFRNRAGVRVPVLSH